MADEHSSAQQPQGKDTLIPGVKHVIAIAAGRAGSVNRPLPRTSRRAPLDRSFRSASWTRMCTGRTFR